MTAETAETAAEMRELVAEALTVMDGDGDLLGGQLRSFADAGLMTSNEGLVVRLANGAEFQVTIVQSAWADDGDDLVEYESSDEQYAAEAHEGHVSCTPEGCVVR